MWPYLKLKRGSGKVSQCSNDQHEKRDRYEVKGDVMLGNHQKFSFANYCMHLQLLLGKLQLLLWLGERTWGGYMHTPKQMQPMTIRGAQLGIRSRLHTYSAVRPYEFCSLAA
eukprot:4676378-Amphidinium_carterae.2